MGDRRTAFELDGGGLPDLVGRDGELAAVRGLLAHAGSGHTAGGVFTGEPGVGKSVLLDTAVAAAEADGWMPLVARGVHAESRLAYAALLSIVRPIRDLVDEIPSHQGDALLSALGWRPAEVGGDQYLIGAAVLSLLATAAATSPVLIVLDDSQWVDQESIGALLFALRRLGRDPVAVLIARRSGAAAADQFPDLAVIELAGLNVAAASDLLGPGFANSVIAELVRRTGGNPLALKECRGRLSAAERAGSAGLPDELPVPARLDDWYGREIRSLSVNARRMAVIAAAAEDDAAAPILAAAVELGVDVDGAVADGVPVFRIERGRLGFRHPLLRAAAYRVAPPTERRQAHIALSGTVGDRTAAVWHRVRAATRSDEQLAEDLAAVADSERRRRGYSAAAAASEQAAGLTGSAERRATYLAAATEDSFFAGDGDRCRRLGRAVVADAAGAPEAVARAYHALGMLSLYHGTFVEAADLFARAAGLSTGPGRIRSLAELCSTRYLLGACEAMVEAAERAAQVADSADPEQAMLADYLRGAASVFAGRPAEGAPLVRRALDLLESDPRLRDDPRYFMTALLCSRWLLDPRIAAPFVDRRMAKAREAGALGVLTTALSFVAYGYTVLGDHVRAYGCAGEAVELADLLGRTGDPGVGVHLMATECAGRGLHAEAAGWCDRVIELSGSSGTPIGPAAAQTLAYVSLCRGDHDGVIRILEEQLDRFGGIGPALEPLGVAPMLVEAYLATGRSEDAVRLAAKYERAQTPETLPITASLVARVRALVTTDLGEATTCFQRSLTTPAPMTDALEAARTRLLFGMRLRRAGHRQDARAQLRSARDQFAAMHQAYWERRATEELAATGERANRLPGTDQPLTSQETRVAVLVAGGATNKEVAATLFLSPKTVEHHLASVLRKRGWRSRVELAAEWSRP